MPSAPAGRAAGSLISQVLEGGEEGAGHERRLKLLADLLWVYARLVEQTGLGTTETVRT